MNRVFLLLSLIVFHVLPFVSNAQQKVAITDGKQLYQKYCMACHQADGGGVPRMTPPLFDTEFTTGDKNRLITIMLKGLNDEIEVQGETYFSPMASFAYLSDKEIASILTYVRTHFGNKASIITEKEVGIVRRTLLKK